MRKSYTRILGMLMALVLLLTLLPAVAFAADDAVTIDETNFPDAAFREYVASNLDADQNGALSQAECDAVTEIKVDWKEISDMSGIGNFQNLISLDCSANELTTLDVSQNPALAILDCHWNKLTTLDVSNNSKLTELCCYSNKLAALDVSKNPALTCLQCHDNFELVTLYLGNHSTLTELCCIRGQLTSLDISNCPALTRLTCGINPLTALDVSKNTKLTYLCCSENLLTTLDVSKNTALTQLDCSGNKLTTLDVSKNTALKKLSCYENKLASLDVSKNAALTELYCKHNQLSTLDVSHNPALETLACELNQLTTLDVSHNPKLIDFMCGGNKLTALDVSKNSKLMQLECSCNQLTALDLSKNSLLEGFFCTKNQRQITFTSTRTIDLSILPGFDVKKANNWQGGTVKGNKLTINANADTVTYNYDCGNGNTATFKLIDTTLPFTDTKQGSWYAGDVWYVLKSGLMAGTSDTTFSPQSATTRGMVATILFRLAGEPLLFNENTFTDVAAGRYYTKAVEWAALEGIVSGYGNGKFGPNDSITREQLASILYRYASMNDYDTSATADVTKFADSNKISNYAKTALSWANGAGLLYGKDNNLLDPKGKATRAELAAILHRFCDKIVK